jgi:hypothetical protein
VPELLPEARPFAEARPDELLLPDELRLPEPLLRPDALLPLERLDEVLPLARFDELPERELLERADELRLPELEPELRLPELPLPELRLPELPLPELRLPELPLPELRLPELPLPELRPFELPERLPLDPLRDRLPCEPPELPRSDEPSSGLSSSLPPISFLATPTAAGTATPRAAPAAIFFPVDIPPSCESCSAIVSSLFSPRLAAAGVVERLDEARDDAVPHDLGCVLGHEGPCRAGRVLRGGKKRVARGLPAARCDRPQRAGRLRAPVPSGAPVRLAAGTAAAVVVRERLAGDDCSRAGGSGGCGGLEGGAPHAPAA